MVHATIIGHNTMTQDLNGFCGVGYGETALIKIRVSSPSADISNLRVVECFVIERGSDLMSRNFVVEATLKYTERRDEVFNGQNAPGVAMSLSFHNNVVDYTDDVFFVLSER